MKKVTEKRIYCPENGIVFVEQRFKDGMFTRDRHVIDTMEDDIGRNAILKRNLVLSNWVDQIQEHQYRETLKHIDHSEACRVHIFRSDGAWQCNTTVKLSGLDHTKLTISEYIKAEMRPGPLVITVRMTNTDRQKEFKIHCERNTNEFVRITFDPAFGCRGGTIDLKLVDEAKAHKAFQYRKRLPFRGDYK